MPKSTPASPPPSSSSKAKNETPVELRYFENSSKFIYEINNSRILIGKVQEYHEPSLSDDEEENKVHLGFHSSLPHLLLVLSPTILCDTNFFNRKSLSLPQTQTSSNPNPRTTLGRTSKSQKSFLLLSKLHLPILPEKVPKKKRVQQKRNKAGATMRPPVPRKRKKRGYRKKKAK